MSVHGRLFVTLFVSLVVPVGSSSLVAATFARSDLKPPEPRREFRGVWVATVANIDWPSQPGLASEQQQAELAAILDRAAGLRLNAVVLSPPPPPLAASHIYHTQPALVRTYGKHLWLDPGEAAVQEHSRQVILDVVRRYDVDGVHMDDYFYPYRERDAEGQEIEFPDDSSWDRYRAGGGRLERDDWRRENVNQFLRLVDEGVHREKPWVKFGLSPFGIWRPGNPPQVKGFDQYALLYADARLWLNEGWVDYFCAAALLAPRAGRAEFPRAAGLVGGGKQACAPPLARTEYGQSGPVGSGGDRRPGPARAGTRLTCRVRFTGT